MEELERVERGRYGIFVAAGFVSFLGTLAISKQALLSVFLAISFGLLASGYYVAKKLTSDFYWALLESEARVHGHTPSKRGTWAGNIVPGVAALLAAIYFRNAV